MKQYKYFYKFEKIIDIPSEIIFQNICDFEHVGFVHKRCFAYNRLIGKHGKLSYLEYGCKFFTPLPHVTHFVMKHEIVSKNHVRNFSKSPGENYWTESNHYIEDIKIDGKILTKYTMTKTKNMSFYLKYFSKLLDLIIDRWSNILWEEDYKMCKRIYETKSKGFKNQNICGEWTMKDGQIIYDANKYS